MNAIQKKVDIFAGCVVIVLGVCFLWPFIYPFIFGKKFSPHGFVYFISLAIFFLSIIKGVILIKYAGGPASAGSAGKHKWEIRLSLVFLLILIFILFVLDIASIEMFIVLLPLIIWVL